MAEETPQNESPAEPADPGPRRSLLSGLFSTIRNTGRDFLAVSLGKLLNPESDAPPAAPAGDAKPPDATEPQDLADSARRVGVMHRITEQLRGAADTFLAAKLDEIEARVDVKLDEIEERINRKINDLHRQFAELRDQELRHRLRLLKITLIFTVLVAVLSLGYNWLRRFLDG